MRKLFTVFGVCSLLVAALFTASLAGEASKGDAKGKQGDGKGKGERGKGRGMETLIKELNLTAEQQAKLKPLQEELGKTMQGLRDLPQDQRREKMRAAFQTFQDGMKKILTPEQLKKMEEMRSKGKGKRSEGKGKPGSQGKGKPGGDK